MIAYDQPSIFDDRVTVRLSSLADGSMKDGPAVMAPDRIVTNYDAFLKAAACDPRRAAYMTLTLDDYLTGAVFTRYRETTPSDDGRGPAAPILGFDALATDRPGHALAVPPADCPVAVLYDTVRPAVMVSHLGRHSVEQFGASRSVAFMHETYGSDPADLRVWVSPSPNGTAYPLWAFDNRSMRDVISEQLIAAGIRPANLEVCAVDTVTDTNYFSHSEFLKGNRSEDGRYLVLAALV